ncbi:hypothetical protein ACFU3J_15945 [Streptomyces sp. NPDC057411]|uniref:hypothetical protein n=1 Tax=unclassified Streptomyces TaxID=2593676 RepID=UPI003639810F
MSTPPKQTDVRPECQFDLHATCKVGDVVTHYGDVVFTVRCACPCHHPTKDTNDAP